MNSNENHPRLTAEIVSKYVAHHKLEAGQLSRLITSVHQAIAQLGQPDESEQARTPAVSVRRSVQHDYVICLDCGFKATTLRRHLKVQHGLSPDEYFRRWGLKSDHPLTAPSYSERRSAMAKELGFGRKASIKTPAVTPASVQVDQQTAATPKPRQKTRRATKAADVAGAAVASPTPARRGRPRSRAQVAPQP